MNALLSKGHPTETVMCRYFAFSKGRQQQLQFEGNLLSKEPPTATEMCKHSAFKTSLKGPLIETVMCKCSAFKGLPTETVMCRYFALTGALNNNSNLKVICFQRGPQQPLKCVSRSTLLLNFIEGALKKL